MTTNLKPKTKPSRQYLDRKTMTPGTLRDEFAMAAMGGWFASAPPHSPFPSDDACRNIAQNCYRLADAMLAAREGKPQAAADGQLDNAPIEIKSAEGGAP